MKRLTLSILVGFLSLTSWSAVPTLESTNVWKGQQSFTNDANAFAGNGVKLTTLDAAALSTNLVSRARLNPPRSLGRSGGWLSFTFEDSLNWSLLHFQTNVFTPRSVPYNLVCSFYHLGAAAQYCTTQQVQTVYALGNEIMNGTLNHLHLGAQSSNTVWTEIEGSRLEILRLGMPVYNLAWPFAEHSNTADDIMRLNHRGGAGQGGNVVDLPPIKEEFFHENFLNDTNSLATWLGMIDDVRTNGGLCNFYLEFGSVATIQHLTNAVALMLDYAMTNSPAVNVGTLKQALDACGNALDSYGVRVGANGQINGNAGLRLGADALKATYQDLGRTAYAQVEVFAGTNASATNILHIGNYVVASGGLKELTLTSQNGNWLWDPLWGSRLIFKGYSVDLYPYDSNAGGTGLTRVYGNLEIDAQDVSPGNITVAGSLSVQKFIDLGPLASTTTNATSVRFWNSNNVAIYVRGTNGVDKLVAEWP